MSERVYTSMAIDRAERYLLAGDRGGFIDLIDLDSGRVVRELWAGPGEIRAIAVHPALPFFGVFRGDEAVAVWRLEDGAPSPLHEIGLRGLAAPNYALGPRAQHPCLAFHPNEPRFLTRGETAGLIEYRFDGERCRPLWSFGPFESSAFGANDLGGATYVDRELIFCTDVRGTGSVIDTRYFNEPLWSVRLAATRVCNLERVEGFEFLVSWTDGRMVARFDLTLDAEPRVGPRITRDPIVQLHYNAASGRAFACSLEEVVYELDPRTLAPLGIAARAAAPIARVLTLVRRPSAMFLLSRGGRITELDLERGELRAAWGPAPAAIIAAERSGADAVLLAGESREVLAVSAAAVERRASLSVRADEAITAIAAIDSGFVAGTARGGLHLHRRGEARLLGELGARINDLAVARETDSVYAALQSGAVHKIELGSGACVATYVAEDERNVARVERQPEARLLAVIERPRRLVLLDETRLERVLLFDTAHWHTSVLARVRWLDTERLLAAISSELVVLDRTAEVKPGALRSYTSPIVDFAWDDERRYLVAVTARGDVILHDFETMQVLDTNTFVEGAPLGAAALPGGPRFLVYGTQGAAKTYSLHDERILSRDCPIGQVREYFRPLPEPGVVLG
jgi:hypothetical protein